MHAANAILKQANGLLNQQQSRITWVNAYAALAFQIDLHQERTMLATGLGQPICLHQLNRKSGGCFIRLSIRGKI
jgi:hypothetical protein